MNVAFSALTRSVVENPQPPAQTPWHIKRAEHCRRGTVRRSASNNVRTTINRLVIKNEIIDRVLSTLYVKEMRVGARSICQVSPWISFGFHLFSVGTGWYMAFLTYPVDQVGPVGVSGVFKMENGQNGD